MNAEDAVERVERLRVREIMIPVDQYPRVKTTDTLAEAIRVMEHAHLEVELRRSLPRVLLVFDDTDRLVGMVRRRDIMRGLEPKFLLAQPLAYRKKLFDVAVDPNLTSLADGRVVRGVREQARRRVAEVMQPIGATLDHQDHLVKAVYEMVTGGRSLLPVLHNGILVGVLRSVEVFHELVQLVE